jgi:glycolate oxidase FAD binding subunit
VLEHAAGDLVVRVQAGVPLADLARVLARAGQRLAVDPPDAGGTVGGLIAAGVAGPLRLRYGLPRDLLIGVTMIRADGVLTRAGGKVVKNVAGYDTGKLLAGSFGTLGLITEATFRLHPVPPAVRYVTLDYARPADAAAALLAVASSTLVPAAAELDWVRASAPVSVAVRFEGDPGGADERAARLRGLLAQQPGGQDAGGAVSAAPPPWWSAADDDGTMLEISFWASRLAGILSQVRAAAGAAGLDPAIGGSGAAGVLHAAVPPGAEPGAVARFVTALRAGLPPGRASAVVRHAPAAVRDVVDLWGPVPSAGLMRAVKDQFDPGHRMAPGRFAGGI